MRFEADWELFARLARNMSGTPPDDGEEIEAYATEIFNIICGRFVSELYTLTGQKARFLPATFGDTVDLDANNLINTVRFTSDKNEGAVFLWTLAS